MDINIDLNLDGWIFTSRLERRLNKIQGEENPNLLLESLKEFNPSAYNHARRLIRGAIWKTRRSKFERYANNLINYFKGLDYV